MKGTVDEHADLVRSLITLPTTTETIPLADALGRVTAAAVLSPVDLPLYRNSQMDGYAVYAADLPGTLPVAAEIPARPGEPAALTPGTAAKIMTGAPMPDGADAVVPVEDSTRHGDIVTIPKPSTPGAFVRERGSDLRRGDELLPAGRLLAPRHLAVLAAAGLATVEVRSRVRVGIITTGAELVAEVTRVGEIFDANAVALVAAVTAVGATVSLGARVSDDAEAMSAALDAAIAVSDVVITSGGISMGDYEVVREVLEPLGASVTTLAMQPGGPQATAVVRGVPVICLPGNPVSTQLSFEIFLAPILREHAGLPAAVRQTRTLVAAVKSVDGKRQFLRGRAVGDAEVQVVSGASSHLVAGLAASDLLVDIPAEITALTKGTTVETWAL
ncbi:MAG: molybdopterin molybdenumtransferase MoeA [Microbacteriaceae bacterium]|nr:molybdopterin molybdenumtransferase MoeA [Microbacteriaceae bacterium]